MIKVQGYLQYRVKLARSLSLELGDPSLQNLRRAKKKEEKLIEFVEKGRKSTQTGRGLSTHIKSDLETSGVNGSRALQKTVEDDQRYLQMRDQGYVSAGANRCAVSSAEIPFLGIDKARRRKHPPQTSCLWKLPLSVLLLQVEKSRFCGLSVHTKGHQFLLVFPVFPFHSFLLLSQSSISFLGARQAQDIKRKLTRSQAVAPLLLRQCVRSTLVPSAFSVTK